MFSVWFFILEEKQRHIFWFLSFSSRAVIKPRDRKKKGRKEERKEGKKRRKGGKEKKGKEMEEEKRREKGGGRTERSVLEAQVLSVTFLSDSIYAETNGT